MHSIKLLSTQLALEWFDIGVDNHVCLQSLFLDKAFEAEVTLVGSDVGVD